MVINIILAGLATILLLIPLPYGSVDEWAIFAFEATVASLFLLYSLYSPLAKKKKYGDKGVKKLQDKTWPEDKASTKDNRSEEESWLGGNRQPFGHLIELPVDYGHKPIKASVASKIVFCLIIIFFVTSLLQIIPWPLSVVRTLSPQKLAIHSGSEEILEGSGSEGQKARFSALSLIPALSRYEFLKYLSYFLFAFLLYQVVRLRREISLLVFAMLAAGLFQAIYGLAEYLSGTGRIFGYTNIWGRGSAFGTFINRDHYAGFLEMIFPLSLGYLLARANFFALKKGVSFRQKVVWFSQERLQQTFLLGALTTVLGLGLLFSRSRSGVIIFLIIFFLMMLALSAGVKEEKEEKHTRRRGIDKLEFEEREDESSSDLNKGQKGRSFGSHFESQRLFGSDFQYEKRKRRAEGNYNGNPGSNPGSRRMLRLVRTVALAVIFVALYIGLRPIIERFTLESFWREARPKFYHLTMRMISDYPLFGTGAGTYIYAYTPYEEEDLHGILHHAHNDYLETIAEMGLIGGGAIILAAFLALGFLFWRWRQLPERDYFRRGVGLGLIAGIVALLIHSVSDFNLRVPANAIYFISFYVLAWRLLHPNKQLG